MEEQENFKNQVASNLIYFRKKNKITQLELAEKLNYSDKAISKWERAESLPDIYILQQLANFYEINVQSLIDGKASEKRKKETDVVKALTVKKRVLIMMLSSGLVWFVATVAFVVLGMVFEIFQSKVWLAFIYAIPVNMIVILALNGAWKYNLHNFWPVSGLSWGVCLAVYLTINFQNLWLLFIAAGVFQVLIILWFVFLRLKRIKIPCE